MPQFGFNATLDDMVRIRKSCPNTHLMSAPPIFSYASSYEVIKSSYSLLSIGIDSVYTANSCKWIREMTDEKIPVISHVGLIPSQVTWIGSFSSVFTFRPVHVQLLALPRCISQLMSVRHVLSTTQCFWAR